MNGTRSIAYFSMEIGVDPSIPTYSGGLGVLAGDTIRSAADMGLPMVAVTLLARKGYFAQKLDAEGNQTELPVEWIVEDYLEELPEQTRVGIEGREVHIRIWKVEVVGVTGATVPVYFLDTDLPENTEWDRTLTNHLYGSDDRYRLCQEVLLGIGGVRALRTLGYEGINRFHMNEGHAALLTMELLDEQATDGWRSGINSYDIEAVRKLCVFTTHTPVPAGHDKFPMELAEQVIGRPELLHREDTFCREGMLNMTYVGLNLSHYVNGVAKKHGETSAMMFAPFKIDAITNGVHAGAWTCSMIQKLFDKYVEGWREDNFSLRYAINIPLTELWQAHLEAKRELIHYINRSSNVPLKLEELTIGFARRSTRYKRAELLIEDIQRLKSISDKVGKIQVVYAGKAHPHDEGGKELIRSIHRAAKELEGSVRMIYLENYDITLARLLTSGVDIWLNTPEPPMEASGTSGMKAAVNGVPSFSVLDGWWAEGCIEGVTGWSIGDVPVHERRKRSRDAESLYAKLEEVIVPMFYNDRDAFINVMRSSIALNASFFNTQRMMQQYVVKAYFD